ncbi:heme-binding domain-containing protein [Aequorivita sp. SDUM287046]|uniref:Heme-binding domain-containing protein n=1 Tax=Aequorivita aurantiaca TaxID=3053356 RepID=A0ABT8DLR1_9FLAO|nr:heme-binding domain-containing protein [Aequorivita aurantiaca]MDN3724911.1 heme-binding domain-containing protein [Aequorivita aurantiaca]
MLKKIPKAILILVFLALVALQFIRPQKNNGSYESVAYFEAETKPSETVAAILRENCYDCHSDRTQYPWYAEIAPFSLWLNDHIEAGKSHFNVSEWNKYSVTKKEHKLEALVEMIENEKMPLKSYAIIHGNLSQNERKILLQWAGLMRLQYKHQLEVSFR